MKAKCVLTFEAEIPDDKYDEFEENFECESWLEGSPESVTSVSIQVFSEDNLTLDMHQVRTRPLAEGEQR